MYTQGLGSGEALQMQRTDMTALSELLILFDDSQL